MEEGGEDEYTGVIIEPVEETCTQEGSVRAGRCLLELLLHHAVGLAIGRVYDLNGAIVVVGVGIVVVVGVVGVGVVAVLQFLV
jgi:hypothetical protein